MKNKIQEMKKKINLQELEFKKELVQCDELLDKFQLLSDTQNGVQDAKKQVQKKKKDILSQLEDLKTHRSELALLEDKIS